MISEAKLKIGFIGAGNVNFGGHGNAWDHASRVEKIPNVEVVGIAELSRVRAEDVLAKRKAKKKEIWEHAKIFEDYRDMLKETKPDAVFIGLPPSVHGSPQFPVELDCVKAGAHILVEKPLACVPPEMLQSFSPELIEAEKNGIIISVAYMFRYSKVIRTMKELANSFGPIRYFNARYHCAYSHIADPWWNSKLSGGPIVEQATHFVDLARYFCGEVNKETIKCTSISATDPLSELPSIPVKEESIPVENRANRVTSTMWKFESGAVGNLTHTVLLQGWRYELQIELFGDGYYIYVHNPYDECRISVRKPGSEQEEITSVPDDPYLHEVEVFLEAVRTRDSSKIASTYADAFKTYKLTWELQRGCNIPK
jgi:predicted dehydrogenase